MRNTAKQASSRTIADMYRAIDTKRPVTITYTKADGSETVRTIEPHDIRTTKNGDVIVKAADRQSGESRTFRIDRITAYTLHRGQFHVQMPAVEGEPVKVTVVAVNTPDELIAREIARDDRDYWTTRYDHVA